MPPENQSRPDRGGLGNSVTTDAVPDTQKNAAVQAGFAADSQALIHIRETTIGGELIQTCDARELHGFRELKTEFKDWFARRIADYGFSEGRDFCSFLSESSGGRPAKEYAVSTPIAQARLRHLARGLHSLGPVALGYFLGELHRGAPLIPALEDYASLAPLADIVRAYAIEPPVFPIEGGRP